LAGASHDKVVIQLVARLFAPRELPAIGAGHTRTSREQREGSERQQGSDLHWASMGVLHRLPPASLRTEHRRPTYRSRMGAPFGAGLGRQICRVPPRRSCECRFSGSALHPIIQGVPMQSRLLAAFASLLLPALASTATPSSGSVLQPDKLVILSTTD